MKSNSFAFIETPLQALEFCAYLVKHEVNSNKITVFCSSNRNISNIFKTFDYLQFYEIKIYSNTLLFKTILETFLSKKTNFYLGSLIGIRNKILSITLRTDKLIIFDDGLNSLRRNKKTINFLIFIKSIINIKKIDFEFFSIFPQSYPSQKGAFSVDLKKILKSLLSEDNNSLSFSNKCFYLCSNSTEDGLLLDKENKLIQRLIFYAKKKNQELIILPHRRDFIKKFESYKYFERVINYDTNFEVFYIKNFFENCTFVTLYSTAILYVDDRHERFFITNVFEPKFKKTFTEKLLFIKEPGVDEAYKFFTENGVKKINYDSL